MAGNPRELPEGLGLVDHARYVPFYLWRGAKDQTPTAVNGLLTISAMR